MPDRWGGTDRLIVACQTHERGCKTEAEFLEVLNGCSDADVKYRDEDGWTVLMMMVISHDWPEAAAAVIKRGCNVNAKARDLDNARALHMAVSYDFAETARVLLENGAEKEARDLMGETPLHAATNSEERTNPEAVRVLLELGCDVNAKTNGSSKAHSTALHQVAEHDHPEIANILLEHGADRTILNSVDETAADVALNHGNDDIAAFIEGELPWSEYETKIEAEMKRKRLFDAAMSMGERNPIGTEENFLKVLNESGEAEVMSLVDDGATLLMWIVNFNDWPEAAAAVIDRGCDVNATYEDGNLGLQTALFIAGENNHRECARVLLERGADRSMVNLMGMTAAVAARRNRNHDLAAYIESAPVTEAETAAKAKRLAEEAEAGSEAAKAALEAEAVEAELRALLGEAASLGLTTAGAVETMIGNVKSGSFTAEHYKTMWGARIEEHKAKQGGGSGEPAPSPQVQNILKRLAADGIEASEEAAAAALRETNGHVGKAVNVLREADPTLKERRARELAEEEEEHRLECVRLVLERLAADGIEASEEAAAAALRENDGYVQKAIDDIRGRNQ